MDMLLANIDQFFQGVSDFFTFIKNFLDTGIYEFVEEIFVYWTKEAMISAMASAVFFFDIAYQVSSDILAGLGLVDAISSALGGLDSVSYQILSLFRIPQAIEQIITALGARFAIKFVPFSPF